MEHRRLMRIPLGPGLVYFINMLVEDGVVATAGSASAWVIGGWARHVAMKMRSPDIIYADRRGAFVDVTHGTKPAEALEWVLRPPAADTFDPGRLNTGVLAHVVDVSSTNPLEWRFIYRADTHVDGSTCRTLGDIQHPAVRAQAIASHLHVKAFGEPTFALLEQRVPDIPTQRYRRVMCLDQNLVWTGIVPVPRWAIFSALDS